MQYTIFFIIMRSIKEKRNKYTVCAERGGASWITVKF